jgi:hypothetical protein
MEKDFLNPSANWAKTTHHPARASVLRERWPRPTVASQPSRGSARPGCQRPVNCSGAAQTDEVGPWAPQLARERCPAPALIARCVQVRVGVASCEWRRWRVTH